MAEGGGGGTRVLNDGGRQRFQVELRPGETTIVSWKKLVKDANRASASVSAAAKPKEQPPVPKPPVLNPRVDPVSQGKTAEDDASDAPPASRFSAVIEKIERLYMGKNSSDEEDLNDVPDDDEYDTEDSFIDDAELDEYFQVDNSEIKHDGFFVNRGKLERMNEPITSPHEQQKKRKRKDMAKGLGGSDEGNTLNKHMAGKKAAGTSLPLTEKNSTYPTLVVALPTVNNEEMMVQNQSGSAGINVKKKSAIVKGSSLQSPLRVTNGEAVGEKGGKAKAGVLPAKNHGGKSKDGLFDMSNQMLIGNISSQGKPQYGRSLSSGEDVGQSAQQGEKNRIREHSDSIFSEGRNPMQATKVPHIQRKEVSSGKSKAVMLEKAIRELEKLVAESRPPSTEASDADNLAQTSKRRMPAEIKPKLAKIARLAHTTQGKLSKDLLNRLMSIVGHLIQLRTLKRNLKVLSEMGLSAKQERTSRFRQLKEEIHEMVKVRVPLIKSKALEQTGGASDDFQEIVTADKEVLKRKFSMDDALEDKICELYDFYVEGLEEETGLHAHKLYGELVELWPKGFMDSHGIKRAISRAKDRKKAMNAGHKNQEKMRRKLSSKTDETRRSETNSVVKYAQGKLVSDSRATSTSVDKVVSVATAVDGTAKTTVVHGPNMDRPKQEKIKGNSNDMKTTEILAGKKQKIKPELVLSKCDVRPDKLISPEGEDKNTSH
ncbi:ubinuclein-1 isoform X1 [Daucus carota subsp. sativus]|uniref:ubinuclein-1 isoform X1 n=1 Tax=Daucus carota subsp. sativus TaxID=79200 RepID=UPI0007EF4EF9|nr:PREDICTED: ubinuclein-1-like isoform X1 [Daucus carota subsp. sativus]